MINKKDRGAFYTTFVLFQMNCVCVLCSLSLIFCHRWMKRLISALISILLISKAWSGAKTLHNSTPSLLNHQGQCSYHPLLQRKLRKSEREPEPASETGEDLTVMHLLRQNSYFNCTSSEITDHHIQQMYDWTIAYSHWKKERLNKWVTLIIQELPQAQRNTSPNTSIPVDESVSSEVKRQVFEWKTLIF